MIDEGLSLPRRFDSPSRTLQTQPQTSMVTRVYFNADNLEILYLAILCMYNREQEPRCIMLNATVKPPYVSGTSQPLAEKFLCSYTVGLFKDAEDFNVNN